jgi:hypothetical protein
MSPQQSALVDVVAVSLGTGDVARGHQEGVEVLFHRHHGAQVVHHRVHRVTAGVDVVLWGGKGTGQLGSRWQCSRIRTSEVHGSNLRLGGRATPS